MKNPLIYGLIVIAFPFFVQAQTDSSIPIDSVQVNLDSIQIIREIQNDPALVRLGNELLDARGSLWESYIRVYEDVRLCSPSNNDAVFDTVCFLGLSEKLTKTGNLLQIYVELLRQNEIPVSIKGFDIYVMIEKNPPNIDSLENIAMKFNVAAQQVIVCVRGRATAGPCSSVSLSVSDAVNSLGLTMDWFEK